MTTRKPGGGRALLAGLATGAVLAGVALVGAPGGLLPSSWRSALGAEAGPGSATLDLTAARPEFVPPPVPRPTPVPLPLAAPPTPSVAAPRSPTRVTPTRPKPPPAVTPTRPSTPAAPSGPAGRVVAATNAERAEAGCGALRVDARLTKAAQLHSSDMADRGYFDHDSPDGRGFADRISAAGYPSPGGENIAYGQETAAEVVQAWMDSPGHRRNILDCSFTAIGVGHDPDGDYWTQDFGR